MIQAIVIVLAIIVVAVILYLNKRHTQKPSATRQGASRRQSRTAVVQRNDKAEPTIDDAILIDDVDEPIIDDFDTTDEMTDDLPYEKPAVVEEAPVVESLAEGKYIPEIINLYIVAKEEQSFSGYELLQSLLTVGLRFGEMNIFHRHQAANGEGAILFSLASAQEPGTFDLSNIGEFSCTGLSLFMQLSLVDDGVTAFELMLETATQLADDLNGELRASRGMVLTESLIEQFRQQALAYQQRYAS